MTTPQHPLQASSFDPLAMLRRNRGDANDVRATKLRVLWLRKEVPEARVQTNLVTLDDSVVVMSATIALPGGGEGAGHAAMPISSGANIAELIETTELRAIGRALDILGYVVTDAPPTDAGSTPERASAESRKTSAQEPSSPPPERPQGRPPQRPAGEGEQQIPAPAPQASDTPDRSTAPGHVQAIRSLGKREQRQGPAVPTPITSSDKRSTSRDTPPRHDRPTGEREPTPITPIEADDDDDPDLEDISWTAFWDWARATYQFTSRVQLEELLGQSIAHKSPKMVRKLLMEHFDQEKSTDS